MSRTTPITPAIQAAVHAYRLACDYRAYILAKWEPRDAELRELDSMHRTRVAWDNDWTRQQWLLEYAGEVLKCSITGERPFENPIHAKYLKECRNRKVVRVMRAINDAVEAQKQE